MFYNLAFIFTLIISGIIYNGFNLLESYGLEIFLLLALTGAFSVLKGSLNPYKVFLAITLFSVFSFSDSFEFDTFLLKIYGLLLLVIAISTSSVIRATRNLESDLNESLVNTFKTRNVSFLVPLETKERMMLIEEITWCVFIHAIIFSDKKIFLKRNFLIVQSFMLLIFALVVVFNLLPIYFDFWLAFFQLYVFVRLVSQTSLSSFGPQKVPVRDVLIIVTKISDWSIYPNLNKPSTYSFMLQYKGLFHKRYSSSLDNNLSSDNKCTTHG